MNPAERPFVFANFAMSVDGKIATRNHTPAQFTSANDKRRLLQVRKRADAIMVGRKTLETDTMSLTVPRKSPAESPLRVVISETGTFDLESKLFQTPGGEIVLFSTSRMPVASQKELHSRSDIHLELHDPLDLANVLRRLKRHYRVKSLLCEGGPQLFRSLLEIQAVDELHLTIAPKLFGGSDAPTLTGLSKTFLTPTANLTPTYLKVIDGECFLTYRLGTKARPKK